MNTQGDGKEQVRPKNDGESGQSEQDAGAEKTLVVIRHIKLSSTIFRIRGTYIVHYRPNVNERKRPPTCFVNLPCGMTLLRKVTILRTSVILLRAFPAHCVRKVYSELTFIQNNFQGGPACYISSHDGGWANFAGSTLLLYGVVVACMITVGDLMGGFSLFHWSPGKRTRTGTRNEIGQKRRRLETRVSNFLDIEAGEGSSEGQGSDNEYFIDGNIDAIGDGDFEGDEEEDEDPSECKSAICVKRLAVAHSILTAMLSVNRQKNYSRDEHNDEDQNQSECRIAVCAEYGSVAHSMSTAVQSVKRQGYSRDDRLSAVINRYEARAAAADDAIESDIENEGEIEEIALLAERALRMPNEHDPGIWRVRVL
ncbi:hypothetical protein F5887DRAFT_925639, partial [Amanita rubescens]